MTDPCIDAEVLAAWADGALDARAAAGVERHAGECARCQAMLAAFVRTEPASAPAPVPVPGMAPWWRSLQIRWLAPLAAAAAAVAIWIAVPISPRPEGELASAEESAMAPPGQAPGAPLASATESPGAAPAPARSNADRKAAPAASVIPKEAAGARQEASSPPAQQRERADMLAAPAERRVAEAAPAPPDGQNRGQAAVRVVLADTAPAGFVSRDGAVRWRLADSGAERSTDGGASWVAALLSGAQELDERQATAPRAGAAAAATVPAAPATPNVGAGVIAGDAPTASICWLVGARGAVWVTADGGQRFRRVTVTGEPDLRTVAARDARSADVTTVDGRTFRTEDGGATWTLTRP